MSDENPKHTQDEAIEAPYAEELTLRGMLGQGGIGRVFLGFDKKIGREVAIKEPIEEKLGANKTRVLARFVREARISGQLEHPGIIPVYEFGTKANGIPFYVMKRVQGRRLKEAIESCVAFREEDELRMRLALLPAFISICDAVGYSHSRKIIHRDLKPSNIVLGEFGEAIILDWGLAKRLDEEADSEEEIPSAAPSLEEMADSFHTMQGALVGTPSYMSPEQIDKRFGDVGTESDVYALGAILFLMLTGEKPYAGTPREVMKQVASFEPSPSPRSRRSSIPSELAAICEKAMAKRKENRFKDAAELAFELKAFRDGRIVSVYAYSRRELFARFVSRNKAAIAAAAVVIVSIVAGAGLALNFAADARVARARAERALVDVTALSSSAINLSSDAAESAGRDFTSVIKALDKSTRRIAGYGSISNEKAVALLKELVGIDKDALALATITPEGKVAAMYPERSDTAEALSTVFARESAARFDANKQSASGLVRMPDGSHVFAIASPIKRGSSEIGVLAVLYTAEKAIPAAMSFDPLKSEYQVWCMRGDGLIFYDEDPDQIGRSLFTDEIYAKFPELRMLGEKIRSEPNGLGYYSYLARGGENVVYKIAAWDTIKIDDRDDLKVVVAYPYRSR